MMASGVSPSARMSPGRAWGRTYLRARSTHQLDTRQARGEPQMAVLPVLTCPSVIRTTFESALYIELQSYHRQGTKCDGREMKRLEGPQTPHVVAVPQHRRGLPPPRAAWGLELTG